MRWRIIQRRKSASLKSCIIWSMILLKNLIGNFIREVLIITLMTRLIPKKREAKKFQKKMWRRANGNTILINLNTAIVDVLHLARWWCARIGNAKDNGFMSTVLMKRNFLMSGYARYVVHSKLAMLDPRKDLNDIEYFIFLYPANYKWSNYLPIIHLLSLTLLSSISSEHRSSIAEQ